MIYSPIFTTLTSPVKPSTFNSITGGLGLNYILVASGSGLNPNIDGVSFFDTGEIFSGEKIYKSEPSSLSITGYWFLYFDEGASKWLLTNSDEVVSGDPIDPSDVIFWQSISGIGVLTSYEPISGAAGTLVISEL